jgi:hypothetical protein
MKEACGYAKESIKNRQVSKVSKQWVLDARLKKEEKRKEEKIAHVFLHLFPSSRERKFQGA